MTDRKIPFTVYLNSRDLNNLRSAANASRRTTSDYARLALLDAILKTFDGELPRGRAPGFEDNE